MKIAILGAGFTGLTAALRLSQKGHEVYIFEKEKEAGGLAIGFKNPTWGWTLEKAYHHWFTNDTSALSLAKELNHKVIITRPSTDVFINQNRIPFDSVRSFLGFPYLSITEKIKAGAATIYLKTLNDYKSLQDRYALDWLYCYMGKKITQIIWEPLFTGKFGEYKNIIALTWFWARIKKRTASLAYPEGGFKSFIEKLLLAVEENSGKVLFDSPVSSIKSDKKGVALRVNNKIYRFDKAIVTLPSPIFTKIAKNLPSNYIKRISSIPHLHALCLILILKKPFMDKTYWLNITDKSFPFLVLAEHTNFISNMHYGGDHILYIGNYLPNNHLYLTMSKKRLLKIFDPYLKLLNPQYSDFVKSSYLFIGPFAQPIVTPKYPKLMPSFITPLKNIYISNLDMVYPWDRGTNYAIEMGEDVAEFIASSTA